MYITIEIYLVIATYFYMLYFIIVLNRQFYKLQNRSFVRGRQKRKNSIVLAIKLITPSQGYATVCPNIPHTYDTADRASISDATMTPTW